MRTSSPIIRCLSSLLASPGTRATHLSVAVRHCRCLQHVRSGLENSSEMRPREWVSIRILYLSVSTPLPIKVARRPPIPPGATASGHTPVISGIPRCRRCRKPLATGNLDLRTHCRVVRILTDGNGQVSGVEYIDPNGTSRVQRGRIVILSAYTFESLRLMFLSGDTRHQSGLGNNSGQLGKSFMTKMFAHVNGYFPDVVFNRHTGPAAQGVVIDDFLSAEFDSLQHGFIGGATLGAEQQFLPIQISREALPSDVCRWGKPYR